MTEQLKPEDREILMKFFQRVARLVKEAGPLATDPEKIEEIVQKVTEEMPEGRKLADSVGPDWMDGGKSNG